jgi:hypothetical protein
MCCRDSSSTSKPASSGAPGGSKRRPWPGGLRYLPRDLPETELKLFKRCVEFQHRDDFDNVPRGIRGIYALLRQRPRARRFDVVYIGMARKGVRARLKSHKSDLWTHFSVYEVFDNVKGEEIEELEGLLRHIYRRDSWANSMNTQKAFGKLARVRSRGLSEWSE